MLIATVSGFSVTVLIIPPSKLLSMPLAVALPRPVVRIAAPPIGAQPVRIATQADARRKQVIGGGILVKPEIADAFEGRRICRTICSD